MTESFTQVIEKLSGFPEDYSSKCSVDCLSGGMCQQNGRTGYPSIWKMLAC